MWGSGDQLLKFGTPLYLGNGCTSNLAHRWTTLSIKEKYTDL